jgi:hypothetical protein
LLVSNVVANSGLHVFDFLANSILKEVLLAIQKVKPGAFSPGKPTKFLKNYKSSLAFLAFLEGTACKVCMITSIMTLCMWAFSRLIYFLLNPSAFHISIFYNNIAFNPK